MKAANARNASAMLQVLITKHESESRRLFAEAEEASALHRQAEADYLAQKRADRPLFDYVLYNHLHEKSRAAWERRNDLLSVMETLNGDLYSLREEAKRNPSLLFQAIDSLNFSEKERLRLQDQLAERVPLGSFWIPAFWIVAFTLLAILESALSEISLCVSLALLVTYLYNRFCVVPRDRLRDNRAFVMTTTHLPK
jgi:hypothetical protein